MDTEFTVDSVLLDQISLTNDDIAIKLTGNIDTDSIQKCIYQLLNLDKKGLKYIPMIIHSGGGCVDDLLSNLHKLHS